MASLPRPARAVLAWLPAVVVVPLALAGAVSVTASEDEETLLEQMTPMEVGTTWVYAVYDHGKPSGTHTKQVTGLAAIDVDAFDAITFQSSYTDYPGSGATSNIVYLNRTAKAVEQRGVYTGHEHYAVEPSAPAYAADMDEGDSWDYDGLIGTIGLRYTAEVEEIGEVEVGGRTFEDCRRIVTTLNWKYGEDQDWTPDSFQEEWTCPGIGQVTYAERDPANDKELTEELVEFHGEDTDWFAEAPPEPEGEQRPGDTLGFDTARTYAVDGTLSPDLAWSDLRNTGADYPPLDGGDVMVLAERDGVVSATDQVTGERRWSVRLTGPVVVAPALAGDRVLVADARKNLWALALSDGRALWVRHFDDIVAASPAVVDDVAIVPTEDGWVTAVDLADSSTIWQQQRPSPVSAAPAVVGDDEPVVVVADTAGGVTAYDVAAGREEWTRDLESAWLAGPAIGGDTVVVADDAGVVYGLDADDGEPTWERHAVYYPSTDFAVSDDTVLTIGDSERLEALGLDDGHEIWSVDVEDTRVPPVVVGDQVVTVDDRGEVTVRDLATGDREDGWSLPEPTDDPDRFVRAAPGLVGDTLVLSVHDSAAGLGSARYAYPVDDTAARSGVSFALDFTEIGDGLTASPTIAGDTVVFPGYDQGVYRVRDGGEPEKLTVAESFVTGVVGVDDDRFLSEQDTSLTMWSTDGDEPLWTYEVPSGLPGQVPAVGDGVAFVPRASEGLAAVSLDDGEELWNTPVDFTFSSSPPLVLPDGDVVFGGAPLARYDARTGTQEWTILDGLTFGRPAYDDGIVFGDVSATLSPSGLGAWDAATGERLWLKKHTNQPIGLSPAAADGVVVAPDSQGLVAAFDARTGKELWRINLPTAVGGELVIIDGVVYVTEAGRKEDLFQRDYQITAHDLHTGELLGAIQPAGSMFTILPAVVGHDDTILAPATSGTPLLMTVRPQR